MITSPPPPALRGFLKNVSQFSSAVWPALANTHICKYIYIKTQCSSILGLISMALFIRFWFCSWQGLNHEFLDYDSNTLTTALLFSRQHSIWTFWPSRTFYIFVLVNNLFKYSDWDVWEGGGRREWKEGEGRSWRKEKILWENQGTVHQNSRRKRERGLFYFHLI